MVFGWQKLEWKDRCNVKQRRRLTQILGAGLVVVSALLATACSGAGANQAPEAADESFLEALVDGWVARWDFLADPEQELALDDPKYAEKYKEQLSQAVNLELDKVEPFSELPFEDSELESRAVNYIGLLEESVDAIQYLNVDDVKYGSLWSDVYDRRTIAILEFIDVYELEIPEAHKGTVAEMRTNADLATSRAETEATLSATFCALDWQQVNTPDEYSTYFDYTATATNPLDTDFSNVWLEVSIIDEGGVNKGTEYASVTNWRAGQTALFELFFLDSPISSFDVSARWETVDGNYGELTSLCD